MDNERVDDNGPLDAMVLAGRSAQTVVRVGRSVMAVWTAGHV